LLIINLADYDFFLRTQQNEWKKELKLIHPVHTPWVELTKDHDIKWEPSWNDKYTGSNGGPHAVPTQFIVKIVGSAKGLCNIFFAIPPFVFFERVAQLTTKYCYDDWVVQRRKKDTDGNKLKTFTMFQGHI
jgi:hypothetical protein